PSIPGRAVLDLDQRRGFAKKIQRLRVGGEPWSLHEFAQSAEGGAGLVSLAELMLRHGQERQRCRMVVVAFAERGQGVGEPLLVKPAEAVLSDAQTDAVA